jgi:hypothetical protein
MDDAGLDATSRKYLPRGQLTVFAGPGQRRGKPAMAERAPSDSRIWRLRTSAGAGASDRRLSRVKNDSPNARDNSSRWSLWSRDSLLSIGSRNSVLSIGSIGSVLSIGGVGSAGSVLSVGSFLSAVSVMSGLSWLSVMAWRSKRSIAGSGANDSFAS